MNAIPSIQNLDSPCEWGEKKEAEAEIQKSNQWSISSSSIFDRIHPNGKALPFLISTISLFYLFKHTYSLLKNDIKNLTLASILEQNILQTQQNTSNNSAGTQKEMIHMMRRSTIYKILAKTALVSSFSFFTLGEYWKLAQTPVRNLRFYSLLSGAISGSAVIYLYRYWNADERLKEKALQLCNRSPIE